MSVRGVIKYKDQEIELLARLMYAEAGGEGNEGMLMVGNVGVNRVLAECLDFKNIRTIEEMVFQHPGGFESTLPGHDQMFNQRVREKHKKLAMRAIEGERLDPATNSLWFHRPAVKGKCKSKWFGQKYSGRWKNHCFYGPLESVCPSIFRNEK